MLLLLRGRRGEFAKDVELLVLSATFDMASEPYFEMRTSVTEPQRARLEAREAVRERHVGQSIETHSTLRPGSATATTQPLALFTGQGPRLREKAKIGYGQGPSESPCAR